jgi:hypothetical protein
MRYGLLLGMALVLSMSLPAMGATVNAGPDSIIIGNATVAPGQTSVSVPVYFVTHGDVTYFNLPLKIEGADNVRFHSHNVATAIEGWDDSWQGLGENGVQALHMGFADLGGEDNPGTNTAGRRVLAFNLILTVDDASQLSRAIVSSRMDERVGGPLFGLGDGLSSRVPVVVNGSVILGAGGPAKTDPLPTEVSLSQNFPNPFNPSTEISFALPDARFVKLAIFNVLGQEVKNLVSGQMEAGFHKIVWDGTNNNGEGAPSGSYFYRMDAGDYSQSMKMVMLK